MTAQPGLQPQRNWGKGAKSATIENAPPTLEQPGSLAGPGRKEFNRRELLTYVWLGTFAALTVGSGVAGYQFLYPRQPRNEFGGRFFLGAAADLPLVGSDPQLNVDGRFWLVNTDEGPRAFFFLCTHAWGVRSIRYLWDTANARFECPMCGSRFSWDGHYFYGPAPRSLDQFVVEIVTGRTVAAKTTLTEDAIEAPRFASLEAEIVVDTGKTIQGLPGKDSPLDYRGQR